jgi:hypothetical protein
VWLAALLAAASLGGSPPVATYAGPTVAFAYPAAWQAQAWQEPTHNFVPLVAVATQPLHDPCAVAANVIRCGWPVERLKRGGTFAWWARIGLLISPTSLVVTNTTVGGRGASLATWRPGHCREIGGDKTLVVTVLPGDLHFEACLRKPGLAAHERQIRALLASTTFSP